MSIFTYFIMTKACKIKISTFLVVTLIIFLPLQIFSQEQSKIELRLGHILPEMVISKSFSKGKVKHLTELTDIKDSEAKIIVNKTILDNGFLLFEELEEDWDGINWVNDYKNTYTYDGNNNLIEKLRQSWDGINWINFLKYTYTYNGNNNVIEKLGQSWEDTNWVNGYKAIYTYDANNNLIEVLSQYWDVTKWENGYKNTYTYDGNNKLIEHLFQNWDSTNWVNDYKEIYTYDVNNKAIEMLRQERYGPNWINFLKYTYTYDENNNLIEQLRQDWDRDVANWMNSRKYIFIYDKNNNLIELLGQEWDGIDWVNDFKWTYTYDVNNNLIEELDQLWDENVTNWVNLYRYTYSYMPIIGIEQLSNRVNNFNLSNNYPNPVNPTTTIEFTLPMTSEVTLQIFSILGEVVATLVLERLPAGNYKCDWDASGMASGVYLYRLQADNHIETRKMVVMR
jgi:hypothetical protein